ncbi:hypothetical protein BHM03_00012746, partial [Ensete ventricosum]
ILSRLIGSDSDPNRDPNPNRNPNRTRVVHVVGLFTGLIKPTFYIPGSVPIKVFAIAGPRPPLRCDLLRENPNPRLGDTRESFAMGSRMQEHDGASPA